MNAPEAVRPAAPPAGDRLRPGAEAGFSIDSFLQRSRERLYPEPPPVGGALANPGGDHAVNGEPPPFDEAVARPAAVLVPVVLRPEPTLLLTQRPASMRSHAGQVAFPGGKVDPEDGTPLNAALREAEEEIGLARRFVKPLGYLDPYITGTGYRIVPVVSVVEPGFRLQLNPDEVEAAFEAPLAFLMNPANHELRASQWQGRMRRYWAMPWKERFIWGATAGIIHNLYRKFYG
ncbi:CoA pyrophosphatase [Camelimonas abortus]|uniref:CoA pyrophosphatase n=1 Tax=Camelimonas abortus TaxID=1017184 RepID=A0ABV7LH32_9HYPH